MTHAVTLIVGLIFGFGLALSGMTHPEKVLGFLDVAGQWDPSLLLVLGGAVGVTVVSFRFILKLQKPLLAPGFILSNLHDIDRPLVVGSALFGLGWGISGYCPGPAIALFAAPNWELLAFFPALLAGYVLQRLWESRQKPAVERKLEVVVAETIKLDSEPPACG